MKVNQISQGFPSYLSHKAEIIKEDRIGDRRIEFNQKRNRHQNIFSDQYHNIPSSQVKNPFLKQAFNIGEARKQWQILVEEKVLPPIKVYDCLLDKEQIIPRETIVLKNKNMYPQYYSEAFKDQNKMEFRRQSGAFMQQASEINKVLPIFDLNKTPSKNRLLSSQINDSNINNNQGSKNNLSSLYDISAEKQQKSQSYQSRPSVLRQSMLMEQSNFFTPKMKSSNYNNNNDNGQDECIQEYDEEKEEERRNLYLSHDPKYINQIEHSINKSIITNSIKSNKSKSLYKLNRDLQGQFLLKSNQNHNNNNNIYHSNNNYNTSSQSPLQFNSSYSMEKLNSLKRSAEFQNFEDELTKFEKELKLNKKKSQCAWMNSNINNNNNVSNNKSSLKQNSQIIQNNSSLLSQENLNDKSQIINLTSKQEPSILQQDTFQNISSPQPYDFNFNPVYSEIR